MLEISKGLIYEESLNTVIYSNEFILDSGLTLREASKKAGDYSSYISDNIKDLVYAKSKGISIFDESVKAFNYDLVFELNLEELLDALKEVAEYPELIEEEYEYLKQDIHNVTLLKIAFLVRNHLDEKGEEVYIMRGSGISSYIMFVLGLNKVNPLKFSLDYRDFWNIN